MKDNIEKMAGEFLQKIKSLLMSEQQKRSEEINDIRKEMQSFKLDLVQKTHEFQVKQLERELHVKTMTTKTEQIEQTIKEYDKPDFDFELYFDEEQKELTVFCNGLQKSVKIPTMVYRGIYTDEETYGVGDTVTQNGSMWVCKQDDTKTKPGTEEGKDFWQLSVKKGRDAKDTK